MARREKKSKINLKVWVPIICIVVVGVTFFMLYDIQKRIEKMKDYENATSNNDNTTANENVVNEQENQNFIEENVVQNEDANTAENNTIKNTTVNQNTAQSQPGITDKKQKAIELVKKEWGKDDTVDFVFDYVNANGEYVVAVKDRATVTTKYYFRVNLETKTVEPD